MKLNKLQLENFRNYEKYEFNFDENRNLIVLLGENGKGKTNFLEAIYLLSLGKSFRTSSQDDLLKWKSEYLRLNAEIFTDNENTQLEFFYSVMPRRHKGLKKDGVKLKNTDYLGSLLTVLFQPEDLNMLYLQPSLRRQYMNILLSQTDKLYLSALISYNKVLRQRNALLASMRDAYFSKKDLLNFEKDLAVWNEELIRFGGLITQKRAEFVEFLDEKLEEIYCSISGENEKVTLDYQSNILKKRPDKEAESIRKFFEDELFNRKQRELMQAKTTAGPHRDDLIFYINGKAIASSASRGEFRTLLLAMKLAEIEYIRIKSSKNPILLLDDVFSELDQGRSEHFLESIQNCQTIITTTDENSLGKLKNSQNLRIVKIE